MKTEKLFLKPQDKIELKLLFKEICSRKGIRMLILKMLDEGIPHDVIARCLFCDERTVRNIKKKYLSTELDFTIGDAPRNGKPRKVSKVTEELIVANVCTNPPKGFSRWTLKLIKQSLEDKNIATISKETIRIILGNRKIKPWIHKMWCIPNVTPEFIERMEDVLEVYEKPYDPLEPVVCLDEKLVLLLGSTSNRKEYKDQNGITKQDYEYIRNGTANVFCAIESKAGNHITQITDRRTKIDFAIFIKKIIDSYQNAKTIHIVMDNLNTHREASLIEHFGEFEGKRLWAMITPHYTPKHASWLNQAEIEIGIFTKMCLGKRRLESIQKLTEEADAWNNAMNKEKIKIIWKFSREKAKAKFKYSKGKN